METRIDDVFELATNVSYKGQKEGRHGGVRFGFPEVAKQSDMGWFSSSLLLLGPDLFDAYRCVGFDDREKSKRLCRIYAPYQARLPLPLRLRKTAT